MPNWCKHKRKLFSGSRGDELFALLPIRKEDVTMIDTLTLEWGELGVLKKKSIAKNENFLRIVNSNIAQSLL